MVVRLVWSEPYACRAFANPRYHCIDFVPPQAVVKANKPRPEQYGTEDGQGDDGPSVEALSTEAARDRSGTRGVPTTFVTSKPVMPALTAGFAIHGHAA